MVFKIINETSITWIHNNIGDQITGTYLKKDVDVGVNKSNAYVIETKDGKLSVWGSTVLDNLMEKVQPNDLIRITYLGKDTKKGYHRYHLEKDNGKSEQEDQEDQEAQDNYNEAMQEDEDTENVLNELVGDDDE